MTNPDVLIIGGGLAGLTAATILTEKGKIAIVLDKGRGPGGRMSTRRMGEARCDHGAQFFPLVSKSVTFGLLFSPTLKLSAGCTSITALPATNLA